MNSAVDRLQADAEARQRALALASFIVEAPAGAGKTELLTQRYLRLLAVVDAPEEVLALTFTNKAATEMRDRILGSLTAAASPPPADLPPHKQETRRWALAVLARDAERQWGVREHPGRLRITTLDALCAGLARQMPLLSCFGRQPAVSDDAESLYRLAARQTLAMLEDSGAEAEVVAAALAALDNDAGRLETLLVDMLGRRDQWLRHALRLTASDLRAEVDAGFGELLTADLRGACALFDAGWQQRLMPLARFAAGQVPEVLAAVQDWQQPLAPTLDDLPRWQAVARLLLTSSGSLRQKLDKRIGFPADAAAKPFKQAMGELLADLQALPELPAALQTVLGLPPAQLDDAAWAMVEAFAALLKLAAGQLWLVFQQAGEVDFIEIAARARQALGDDEAPTDLAQALDYRIQHLLVDEFQDTSPSQVDLIERLMVGWQADDGRTVFVVGDPMQSIYRFRKAEVGLFLSLRQRGLGGVRLEHLRLYRNNRSCPAVVDWVNQVFPAVFPAEDAPPLGAVRYSPSTASRPDEAEARVELHPLVADSADEAVQQEARLALALIQRARRDDPGGRIAVLVRARRHLDALVDAIRQQAPGLRFQAVEIEGLAERQHVQDLLLLYRALVNRADRVHWLAVLRAPWCGLTLADLHALAAHAGGQTVWQAMHDETRLAALSADGRQRLQQVRAVLGLALAERERQPLRRWLEGCWLMLGGAATLPDAAALADVEVFFDLLDRLAASGSGDPDRVAAQVGELFAPPDPLGDAVQMMTIHKAKGLEFETVIVPGLQRGAGRNDAPLLCWDEVVLADGAPCLLVAPLPPRGADEDGPSLYDYLRRLENERTQHENERLLYVAATRAIRQLHLIGAVTRSERSDDGLKAPASGSFLHLLWPSLAQAAFAAVVPDDTATACTEAGDAGAALPLRRLQQVAVPALLAAPMREMQTFADEMPPAEPTEETHAPLAAAVGTLVHRVLELIASQGLATWPAARLDELRPAWRRWFTQQGLPHSALDEAVDTALDAVRTTLASEAGQWLLAAHEGAAAEQAWNTLDAQGGVRQHVIDRVFIAEGVRWIVDYKTVRAAPADLPTLAESFRPQLARYAQLFAADPRPLHLAIYFPLQGRLVVLP